MVSSQSRAVSAELRVAEALEDEVADASQDLVDGNAIPQSVSASWICRSCTCQTTRFFCPECVIHGNFTQSKDPSGQRFFDRRLTLKKANQKRAELASTFLSLSEGIYRREDLSRAVERKRWMVKSLKVNLQEIRTENDQLRARSATEQRQVDDKNAAFEQLQLNCSDIKKKIISDQEKLKALKQHVKLQEITIIKRRQAAVRHLLRDIFPLIELDDHLDTVASGAKSSRYCRILEPILSLDGDYSAYHNSAVQVRDLSSEVNIRNPFYEVPAGLGMVAQLLEILIEILDFQMPDLLDFGKFFGVSRREQAKDSLAKCLSGKQSTEQEENGFEAAVQQLNWNILTLCSSQGIPVEDLSLKETVGNLLKLTKSKQLGRTGPYDLSNVLVFTDEEPAVHNRVPVHDDLTNTLEAEGFDEMDTEDWEDIPTYSSSVLPTSSPPEQMARSTFGLGTAVNAVSSLFRSSTDHDFSRQKK